jgi:hypothetical protein
MSYIIIIGLLASSQVADSLPVNRTQCNKGYAIQTFISGSICAGFGIAAYINNNLSNEYFASYRMQTTIGRTVNDWYRAVHYENIRDLSLACATIFLIPTVYFEVKHLTARKKLSQVPILDIRYCENRIYVLLKKTF